MIVCVNASTSAVSEYDLTVLDVVSHGGRVFLADADEVSVFDGDGTEEFVSEVVTGQVDFGSSLGKRCPNISLVTGTDTTPAVSIINDSFAEFPAAIRQGYTDKHTRMYNSPRGVLSTRFGYKITGHDLDFTKIDVDVVSSADT